MLDYPQTPRTGTVDTLHSIEVPDPYRWLEDIDSEQTQAWIAEQNGLTCGYLSQIPAKEQIAARMADLWNYEKYDPPFKRGGRYFFTRNDGLQNQSVLYWIESATLIATGDHDDRVFPAHSFKFAAALQAAQAGPAPVLIRVEVDAGHGLGKPTSKLIEEAADLWAFVVHQMGIALPKVSVSDRH
jgi:prolyl oligopeptidase PreP (S9A serine peptidase family)